MAPDGRSVQDWLAELSRRRVFRVAAVYAGVAFVLVQGADYLFDALLFPPWAHRLFVVFAVLGFPVALVLAWAFDLTPDRAGDATPAAEAAEAGRGAGGGTVSRTTAAAVAVVLGAAVAGGWAAWRTWLAPAEGPAAAEARRGEAADDLPATRIAVLYFDDHTEGGSLAHVAAGFTESLIHELNRAAGIDVVSRHGSKPFRDPDVPVDSIARALRAGSLVEGSVEREGDSLLVTVQLIDGATAGHLTSERVRGTVDAPLDVRNELVERVAGLLRRRLGREVRLREARGETGSSRAWELYHLSGQIELDADSLQQAGDGTSARRLYLEADSVLARAEESDPEWRRPTVRRGLLAQHLARLGSPDVADADPAWLRRGIEHADRVLAEDPGHPGALERRGELRYFLALAGPASEADRTLRGAEEDLRRAVSEDPGRAGAWARLAYLLWNQRARFAEARSAMRRSREADPFLVEDRDYLYLRASLALDLEEFDRTDRLLDQASEAYGDDPAFLYKRLQYLASVADSPEEVREAGSTLERFESAAGLGGGWPPGRALMAAAAAGAGMSDTARALLDALGETDGFAPRTTINAAYARLRLGEREPALFLLARYLEAHPGQREYVAREWWWRPLHDDPRFRALVADSTGAVPEGSLAEKDR